MAYMIDTRYTPATKLDPPKFALKSNKQDPTHAQPPHFKIPLRPEQLRSLTWMISSEDVQYAERQTFIEEEIAEAVSEPLGWRVLGRAQRPVHVSGGVLADAVGYGKTAITLGLVDHSAEHHPVGTKVDVHGLITIKATLVVVPPHLTRQWSSEITKFTGDRYNVIVIATQSSLNKVTIKDMKKADLVVVASNIFKSAAYLGNLEEFSAGGSLPPAEGRQFNQVLGEIAKTRAAQVELLKEGNVDEVIKAMAKAKTDGQFPSLFGH